MALKWTFRRRAVGRPPVAEEVRALILKLADNDSNWSYTSIRDRLRNLGHRVSRATVANVLREHDVEPAPKRGRRISWATFLKAHWPQFAAIDFTTAEEWTKRGLMTHYILFVMELATRKCDSAALSAGW